MKSLIFTLFLVSNLFGPMKTEYGLLKPDWLIQEHVDWAFDYFNACDDDQWEDLRWHLNEMPNSYALRSAVHAALEGSNRPRGKHKGESTYQDVGLNKPTAVRMGADPLLIPNHAYAAKFAMEIDLGNIKRNKKKDHKRPFFNAHMQYQGLRSWPKRGLRACRATALTVVLVDALSNPTSRFYSKLQ